MATRTKTTKSADTQLAKQNQEMNSALELMASQSGVGFEDIDRSDLYIPRVKIIQSNSPELDEDHPNYIDGLRTGDIVESQSGINFGKELVFIPVKPIKSFVEWYPRDDQRGIAAIYLDRETAPRVISDKFGENKLANGNRLQETYSFFGYSLFAGEPRETMIAFYSTQLRKAKQLLTLFSRVRMVNPSDKTGKTKLLPPMYYQSFILSTIKEKNQQGNWYGWTVKLGMNIIELAKSGQLNLPDIMKNQQELANLASSKSNLLLTSGLPDEGLQETIADERRETQSDDIPM